MFFEISLIRHGKSVSNIEKTITGFSNTPLAKQGIEELQKLKQEVIYPKADLYFSSPLDRAIDTMKILYGDLEFETLDGFKELNFGIYEQKSYDIEYEFRDKMLNGIKIENGETLLEFRKRVFDSFLSVLEKLKKQNLKKAVIFCHSLVIKTLLCYFENYKTNEFSQLSIPNGRGIRLFLKYDDEVLLIEEEDI